MQIMTAKTTTIRKHYVHVVLNGGIFPHTISYDIIPYARHFSPVAMHPATAKYNLDR